MISICLLKFLDARENKVTFRTSKTFLAVLIVTLPIFAFAAPTWQSTYNIANEYCSWGKFTDHYPDIEIGKTCSNEGEEVEIFDSGSSGYECDPYTTIYVICCGDKVKCPIYRDQNEYQD